MKIALALLCQVLMVGMASAAEPASGDEIRAAIAGNTIKGNMTTSGPYAEFYAEDGVIKGKDYTGAWRIDADRMCFKYGADPEDCWSVVVEGNSVQWVKSEKTEGTGTIVEGNPNGF